MASENMVGLVKVEVDGSKLWGMVKVYEMKMSGSFEYYFLQLLRRKS